MIALLIDDDREFCAMMQELFAQSGHAVDIAQDGRTGLKRVLEKAYDIILLDVMLPAISGFSVLQQIRRSKNVPVIMLTARAHRDDRIQGLNSGADDYLNKPFDTGELMARIGAVLRRAGHTETAEPVRRFGRIEIHVTSRMVYLAGRPVDLTSMEFDIFELLTRRPGRPVAREEMSLALLGRPSSPDDRALDVHVSHLRNKLEGRSLIRAVRSLGYVFAAEPQP